MQLNQKAVSVGCMVYTQARSVHRSGAGVMSTNKGSDGVTKRIRDSRRANISVKNINRGCNEGFFADARKENSRMAGFRWQQGMQASNGWTYYQSQSPVCGFSRASRVMAEKNSQSPVGLDCLAPEVMT